MSKPAVTLHPLVSLLLTGALFAGVLLSATAASAQTRLLRFPDLHGDRVAFTYAGDLWTASAEGGAARRLTSHPGVELFPRFSPDGQWIAFTGQIDGDEQVYVVPAEGGEPRQLTFYPAAGPLPPRWGYDNQVYGWTPDGSAVLFRSMRDAYGSGDTRLYTVSVDGGLPEVLPMPESGGGDLSPDGGSVVYSPVTRDFRHWKRYQGGWAQDLYVLDLETLDGRRITDHPRSDRDPMWIGSTIYFSSDRDDVLNLYAFDLDSGDLRQVTAEDRWDVRWPSADHQTGRIVYELNGQLVVLDLATEQSRALEIQVPTDALAKRPRRVSVVDQIQNIGLSPEGHRALFAARGDIFTVPAENGATRNLTRSPGANDREPAWSHDGRSIAFVSDRTGEEEIWIVDHQGRSAPRQLTSGSRGRYTNLSWSPDGEHLAFQDHEARTFVVPAAGGDPVEVADDGVPFPGAYSWSPDGRWITLSLTGGNGFSSIWLWSLESRELHRVTDELWNEFAPAFDPKGDYVFFVADREFGPQIGSFEFNYVADRESYLYAVALRDDVPHLYPPRNDEAVAESEEDVESEESEAESEKTAPEAEENGGDEDPEPIAIDLEGLSQRVMRVPVPADNYAAIVPLEGKALVVKTGPAYYGRESATQPELLVLDHEKRVLESLTQIGGRVAISPEGSKLLVQSGSSFQLYDPSPGAQGKPLSTAGLQVDVVPEQEWRQVFDEVWRRFRDFFYVENMHGYDWSALQERYEPLLQYVAHRSDLNYVISEMISELNVSHAYITGGDYEVPDRPTAALLGARFELDGDRYRIARIFEGHNEEPTYRSPLTDVGVGVEVGDYLLAINGVELTAEDNPFRLLRHAGGAPVELLVGASPSRDDARYVLVDPIGSEDDLLYLQWVLQNRRIVEERSGGRLGYIHIPDMGAQGIREWIKWYYGQLREEGLVIDVRSNGGGNVSSMILERLRREVLMMDWERHRDIPDTYPSATFHGHLAALIDEDTASDGDQFAYVFRQSGLGPLIGKRTWGGVVGIYGRESLVDGGGLSVPEAGSGDLAGGWIVEGEGVTPDIEIENTPKQLLDGYDAQLEKAIEVLLDKIEQEPMRLPDRPTGPDKTPGSANR